MRNVLGQERAREVLQRAAAGGRTHHAWIFHGPVGVGKFTTAMAWARVLLCPNAQPNLAGAVEACGSCESCKLAEAGTHPDLHVIRKELASVSSVQAVREAKQRNIPIDLLRERMIGGKTGDGKFQASAVGRTAVLGHGKVFIIDEAELMDQYGQNALLKTLEEPPAQTYIILITSSEEQLLATIRSRCQRLGFGPLPGAVVEGWLERKYPQLKSQERAWLAGFADGSLGRAELGAEFGLAAWGQEVLGRLESMKRGEGGTDLGGVMANLLEEFAQQWVAKQENASKEAANQLAARLMGAMVGQWLRREMGKEAAALKGADLADAEQRLEPYAQAIDALTEAQRDLAANVNVGLVCDHLVSMLERALTPNVQGSGSRV